MENLSRIERLPVELKLQIFRCLDTADLYNVVLVNRTIRKTATEALYSHRHVRPDESIRELLDIFLLKPDRLDLASFVKSLDLPAEPEENPRISKILSPGITVPGLELSDLSPGFQSLFRALNSNAVLALFLSTMKRINELSIRICLPESAQSDDAEIQNDHTTTIPTTLGRDTLFQNLRTLRIEGELGDPREYEFSSWH